MQEEVEQKTINLAVTVTKFSWRVITGAVRSFINYRRHKQMMGPKRYRGKQTVKQLLSQDQGATSLLVGDEGIKDFQRIAKRYGVDFAITKDKSVEPPKYTVFFKAKDMDALEAVMNEFEQIKAFNLSVIQSRYEEKLKAKNNKPKWKDRSPDSLKFLVDVEKKMREGKGRGYENWARKFNLKQRAKVLLFLEEHGISSFEELVKITDEMQPKLDALNSRIKKRQEQMAANKEIQRAVIVYAKTKEIYTGYKNSKYSSDYYREHEDALKEHEWARGIYRMYADGEPPKMKDLRDQYGELLAENKTDFAEYVKLKKDTRDYLVARKNLELLMTEKETEEREKAKSKTSRDSRSETSL